MSNFHFEMGQLMHRLSSEAAEAQTEITALRERVAKLERVAEQLCYAMQMQTDYESLPCVEMDAKYGRVVDLTIIADVVSAARAALDAVKKVDHA